MKRRRYKPVSEAEAAEMRQLYGSGEMGRRDLAAHFDRSLATIHKYVTGTPEPPCGWRNGRERIYPWERITYMSEKLKLSGYQIAQRFPGMHPNTVYKILRKSKEQQRA